MSKCKKKIKKLKMKIKKLEESVKYWRNDASNLRAEATISFNRREQC